MGKKCSLGEKGGCRGPLYSCPAFKGKTYCQRHHDMLHNTGPGKTVHGRTGAGINVTGGPHSKRIKKED